YVGMPEGAIILAQATTYLASTNKSNASYNGLNQALSTVRSGRIHDVPLHLRNAPTDLMKSEGYSEGYKYPHDYENHFTEQQYLPDQHKNVSFYKPSSQGREKFLRDRLRHLWDNRYQFSD
nr:replication-associated recombination protein A [Gammaproteobacteria bacterium]NIX57421.1 replication-associated recombination protein A [candidate division Zixibacteria bacterium]